MKKLFTFLLSSVALCLVFVVYNNYNSVSLSNSDEFTPKPKPELRFGQKFKGAADHWHEVLVNQNTGTIPLEDVQKSRKSVEDFRKKNSNTQRAAGENLKWDFLGPSNIGGRSRALHFDVNDATYQTIYTGGVTGGLWKTTDGGKNWHLLESSLLQNCRNVTSITQTDNGTLYVGTGSSFESIYESGFANAGAGIFKSTDGGETLELIEATNTNNSNEYTFVNRLATNGSRVFAATGDGLKYTDDGDNWMDADISNSGTSQDVIVTSNGNVYVTISNSLYFSNDGGSTFSEKEEGIQMNGNRKVLGSCEAQPNVVYLGQLVNSCILDIYKTTNNGDTWTKAVDGGDFFNPVGLASAEICQGTYDLALAVDPNNPDKIFAGGLTLWTWTDGGGAYQVDNYYGSETSPYYTHPDKHFIAFEPGNSDKLYVVTDGGVYLSDNASSTAPTFTSINKGLGITQFYNIDAGINGTVIGGAQDNGTTILTYNYNSIAYGQEVSGGDGGYCYLSRINPQIGLASSQEGNLSISTNGGSSGGSFLNQGTGNFGPADETGAMQNARFINPHAVWEDTELFYDVMSTKVPKDAEGNYEFPYIRFINGQQFVFTDDFEMVSAQKAGTPASVQCNNPSTGVCYDSGSNYGCYVDGAVNVYTEEILYIAYDVETDQPVPSPKFQRSIFASGNNSGFMWITYDMLNLGVTPCFVRLGTYNGDNTSTAGGSVTAIAFSADGDDVYFGTSGGRVTRTSKLTEAPRNPVQKTVASGRFISSISVNPDANSDVLVTCGNYGNDNYLYFSSNADGANPNYSSVQGDLPPFPLFASIQYNDFGDNGLVRRVLVGGEHGVWMGEAPASDDTPDFTWTEENGMNSDGNVINSTAVTTLIKTPMVRGVATEDVTTYASFCDVIYAGTHGNGAFRTISLTDTDYCGDVVDIAPFAPTSVQSIDESSISVYPNPTVNDLNIELPTNFNGNVIISVYNMSGKLAKQFGNQKVNGNTKLTFDVSDLMAGNYIVTVANDKKVVSKKLVVAK